MSQIAKLQGDHLPVGDLEPVIACEHNLKFMSSLADEQMSLIITSPPYNIGKEYEERTVKQKYIDDQADCIAEAVRLLAPDGINLLASRKSCR